MIDVDRSRPTTIRWRVFALACATSFLLYLHRYTWNIVGPEIQERFDLTNTQAQFLFSLFYYTYAACQIPSGVVIDRYGPHRFLSAIMLSWSVALAALGMTSWIVMLGVWRLIFGAAQAGCYPALTKVTRSWFPEARRTAVQGWIATASGRSGGAMAPILLGTVLMSWLGMTWYHALLVLGAAGVACSLGFWLTFRDTPAEHPGVNDSERALIESGATVEQKVSTRSALPAGRAVRSVSLRFFVVQQFLDAGSDVVFVSLIGHVFPEVAGARHRPDGLADESAVMGGSPGRDCGRVAQ